MDYLAYQLLWYLVFAFVVGACVGWFSCVSRQEKKE